MRLQQIWLLLKRRKTAKQFGLRFDRSALFKLPEKILLNNKQYKLALPNEHGVKVAFIELILDDCYKCNKIAGVQNVKTILEIGANVGLFGLSARAAFPNAVIHAYEPNPFLEKYLSCQAEATKVTFYMEAVGAEEGHISLDFNDDSVQTKSHADPNGHIPQIALRTAIERLGGKVDFLKMDCEGAEWEIFKDKDSWKNVRHLSMEYHLFDGHTTNELKEVIKTLGFVITSFMPCEGFGLLTATKRS